MPAGRDPAAPPPRRVGALFWAAVVLHGLAYLLLLPPWMGEDEHWHLEVAHHVARGHVPFGGPAISADETELPFSQLLMRRRFRDLPDGEIAATQRAFLAAMHAAGFWKRVDWAPRLPAQPPPQTFDQVERFFSAAAQPPLHYLVTGAWIRLASDGSPNGELWSARVLSLFAYAATVALTLVFARTVVDDERVAVAAALAVAWLPVHARQAGVVNNDVLAKVLASAALVVAARWAARRVGNRTLLVLVPLLVLAPLAKASAMGALAVALAAALVRGGGRRGRWLALGAGLALVAALVAVVLVAGHSPVFPRGLEPALARLRAGLSAESWAALARTAVGTFNWESRALDPWVVRAFWALALPALVAGALRGLRGRGVRSRGVFALALVAVLAQLALVVVRGVVVGRYLAPAAAGVGVLAALGSVGLLPERLRGRGLLAAAALALAFDGLFLTQLLWHGWLAWGA